MDDYDNACFRGRVRRLISDHNNSQWMERWAKDIIFTNQIREISKTYCNRYVPDIAEKYTRRIIDTELSTRLDQLLRHNVRWHQLQEKHYQELEEKLNIKVDKLLRNLTYGSYGDRWGKTYDQHFNLNLQVMNDKFEKKDAEWDKRNNALPDEISDVREDLKSAKRLNIVMNTTSIAIACVSIYFANR
uniref:Uncharacterized protein n=1 Tax=Pithovirus LCPAC403 TaxID=2506596 RepID=A0A481ZBG8_9VIRU|nr:MAG: hypothetical protein LCPAC403_01200 [Pithovirus LCPAC403]